jgi:drug/metabolite transporter (DMT)-like permease
MSRRTFAIVALVIVMIIWGSSFAATKASLAQVPPITFAFLRLLYVGVLSSAFGYFLYNWSLGFLSAGQTGNFVNLIPIAGVVIAVLFLGEAVVPAQLVGHAAACAAN